MASDSFKLNYTEVFTLVVLAILAITSLVYAVSNQSVLPGTAVQFSDTGGTVTFTLSAITAGTGRVSAVYDFGGGANNPHPAFWELRCFISLNGTHTIAAPLEFYVLAADSAGANLDGGVTANSALASTDSDKRRAFGAGYVLPVYQTTNLTTMVQSWRNIYIPQRYGALAFWNGTAIPTETSTTKHKCTLTPMPFQMSGTQPAQGGSHG